MLFLFGRPRVKFETPVQGPGRTPEKLKPKEEGPKNFLVTLEFKLGMSGGTAPDNLKAGVLSFLESKYGIVPTEAEIYGTKDTSYQGYPVKGLRVSFPLNILLGIAKAKAAMIANEIIKNQTGLLNLDEGKDKKAISISALEPEPEQIPA